VAREQLFGSEKFDHLIGRTSLATLAAAGAELKRDEVKTLTERREIRLAIKLAALLQGYLDGDESVREQPPASWLLLSGANLDI